jgi:hypothetical protein
MMMAFGQEMISIENLNVLQGVRHPIFNLQPIDTQKFFFIICHHDPIIA